jgi:hypothetical protein
VPLPVTGRDAQRVARLGLPRNIFHAPIIERDLVERRLRDDTGFQLGVNCSGAQVGPFAASQGCAVLLPNAH